MPYSPQHKHSHAHQPWYRTYPCILLSLKAGLLVNGVRFGEKAGCVRKGEGLLGGAVDAGGSFEVLESEVYWKAEGRSQLSDTSA
eukprot:scaffold228150_cov22-Tisochrysis_lutea.AAC.1